MTKALEWGDKIPLGIIYKDEKKSYTDHFDFLKESTLLEIPYDKKLIQSLIEEFTQ
jgi:2-oxoglutarate ferredoxin oxidoreductase subunit beta